MPTNAAMPCKSASDVRPAEMNNKLKQMGAPQMKAATYKMIASIMCAPNLIPKDACSPEC